MAWDMRAAQSFPILLHPCKALTVTDEREGDLDVPFSGLDVYQLLQCSGWAGLALHMNE